MTVRMVSPESGPGSSLVLRGGRIYNPARNCLETADVLIESGLVTQIGTVGPVAVPELDCRDWLVAPSLIDMHVHLRHPGQPDKETIASGTRAAAAGGFGTVLAMANTRPVVDSPEVLNEVFVTAAEETRVRMLQVGAVSVGLQGTEPADHAALVGAGAAALSDDGHNVHSAQVMRQALRASAELGVPVLVHAEDRKLAAGGVMNLGALSRRLGLPGMDAEAEAAVVERDLQLLREEGGRLHLQHLSAARSFELLEQARAQGLAVSAEVTPHHLALTEEEMELLGGMGRVNPPLRGGRDREATRAALESGLVSVIATDHAPHELHLKKLDPTQAPPGYTGLETALGLLWSLVRAGLLSELVVLRALTAGPAQVLAHVPGLPAAVAVGASANLVVIDPMAHWQVEPAALHSCGHNTPLLGRDLVGRVRLHVLDGAVIHQAGEVAVNV